MSERAMCPCEIAMTSPPANGHSAVRDRDDVRLPRQTACFELLCELCDDIPAALSRRVGDRARERGLDDVPRLDDFWPAQARRASNGCVEPSSFVASRDLS